MPTSLNGWTVLTPGSSLLTTKDIPGTTRRITMRRSVIPLFLALASEYDDIVRDIDKTPDDGGYAYRDARAAARWSNHASGTALDLNWSGEGAQNSTTGKAFFSKPENKARVNALKKEYEILTWGGDWNAKDYMHWELSPGTTQRDVDRVIKKLGINPDGTRAPKGRWDGVVPAYENVLKAEEGLKNLAAFRLAERLHDLGYYQGPVQAQGSQGYPANAVKAFQAAHKIKADGIYTPALHKLIFG